MIHLQNNFHQLWSSGFDRLAHSRLAWGLIVVIIVLWAVNLVTVITDYQERMLKQVEQHQELTLDHKREELEDLFGDLYQHTRTISLIPAIRGVQGENRRGIWEDVVTEGRLSIDTHDTVQQIYTSLTQNIQLSEIYYVLKGFRPDLGEVPFFMYDDVLVGHSATTNGHPPADSDTPIDDESSEYLHYVEQLDWFADNYPTWNFTRRINEIPALISPLLRTCDSSQYSSITYGDVRNSYGLLYSIPVYGLHDNQFKGLISAVLRANVLESLLLGVPFIPVTNKEIALASEIGWTLPDEPAAFLLTQDTQGIAIYDRRNTLFSQGIDAPNKTLPGRWASVQPKIVSNGTWQLHHYLTPQQIETLTAPLRERLSNEVLARILLLIVLMLIFWRAIRDQRLHHAELTRLALYDSLTALPNRQFFLKRLDQSIARAQRHKVKLGLLYLDIDNFGSINNRLGHSAGDAILIAIVKRIREQMRLSDEVGVRAISDTFARLGGDEFTIIFEDLSHPEDGLLVSERLLNAFQEPIDVEGHIAEVSLSGGMAFYPDDATQADELMTCADHALRHATELGSGQFHMFNDAMRIRAARHTQLMHDLSRAIRNSEFFLVYQPKQSLVSGRVVSFEALIRWAHPELGLISPVEFIPLLEQNSQIVQVGKWVLKTACEQLVTWQRDCDNSLSVSVNVSPRQLLLSDMVKTVDEALNENGLKPETLIIEITESMVIDNLQEGNQTLERLRDRGVKLAIDDFGTGYSSLTYLQGLPLDYLKLDKSMIDRISDPRGAHVVRATIDLAHGLGLRTIAEGVEESYQKELLMTMGCDLIQGYLLARPMPAGTVGAFIANCHC